MGDITGGDQRNAVEILIAGIVVDSMIGGKHPKGFVLGDHLGKKLGQNVLSKAIRLG